MDQILISLGHTPPTSSSSTVKMHVEYNRYHIAMFSNSNNSYVLFLNTDENFDNIHIENSTLSYI